MTKEKRVRAKTTNGPKVVSELKKLGYEAEFRCDMQPLWGYVVTHAPHRVVDAAFKAALDPSRVITSDEVEVAKQVATKAAEAAIEHYRYQLRALVSTLTPCSVCGGYGGALGEEYETCHQRHPLDITTIC
jgi:tRNA(Arg) A34 adenosine deaminase TadA